MEPLNRYQNTWSQVQRIEKQGKVEQIEQDKRFLALVMNGSLRGANCQIEHENPQ
jgi:hypothetical protein